MLFRRGAQCPTANKKRGRATRLERPPSLGGPNELPRLGRRVGAGDRHSCGHADPLDTGRVEYVELPARACRIRQATGNDDIPASPVGHTRVWVEGDWKGSEGDQAATPPSTLLPAVQGKVTKPEKLGLKVPLEGICAAKKLEVAVS